MLFAPPPFFSAAVADKYQNFTQNTALIYHNKTTHFPYYLVIQSGAVRHAIEPLSRPYVILSGALAKSKDPGVAAFIIIFALR